MGTITVTNLGKAYRQYPTRWSRLAEWVLPSHKHRLENPGVVDVVMIEVQSGEYLGEGDIVRFQDNYGRA